MMQVLGVLSKFILGEVNRLNDINIALIESEVRFLQIYEIIRDYLLLSYVLHELLLFQQYQKYCYQPFYSAAKQYLISHYNFYKSYNKNSLLN